MSETERRLQDLNQRLRESLGQIESQNQTETMPSESDFGSTIEPGMTLGRQLDDLEALCERLQNGQNAAKQQINHSIYMTGERLGHINTKIRGIATDACHDPKFQQPIPPDASEKGFAGQVDFLEAAIEATGQIVRRLIDDNRTLSSSVAAMEETSHYKTVLLGLWEILVGGEEELRRQDPVQREVLREDFSLQLFSNKVQTLFARATGLQEQKEILSRQVQQQRELNTQSDSTRDAKISEMSRALEQQHQSIAKKEQEVKEAHAKLALMNERLESMRQEASLLEQQHQRNETSALAAERQHGERPKRGWSMRLKKNSSALLSLKTSLQMLKTTSVYLMLRC